MEITSNFSRKDKSVGDVYSLPLYPCLTANASFLVWGVQLVTAENRHTDCPQLIEHNMQQAHEAQGKLGVVKIHQMKHDYS